GLDDVRRGAAGVPGSGDALGDAERRDPDFDAVAFGSGGELLEGEPHGGGDGRPVGRGCVEPRLSQPHLECAAPLIGADPSANRHQSLFLSPIVAISSPSSRRPTTFVRPSESVPPVTGSVIAAITASTVSFPDAEAAPGSTSNAPAHWSRVRATSPVAREDPSRHFTATAYPERVAMTMTPS